MSWQSVQKKMFHRQNAGKSINGKQLRIVHESDQFSDIVYSLTTHPFMGKLMTNAQRNDGSYMDLIIQTMMLILNNQNNDYTSFISKGIDMFAIDHSEECIDKIDTLKETLNGFDTAFDTIKIPITSIHMVLQVVYSVKKKKSFTKSVDIINKFFRRI